MAATESARIIETYFKAFEEGDFDRVRSCLSDSFTYTGPTARFDTPDSFLENIWHVGQILHHIEHRKTFVDGDNVCSIMNFHVHLDEPRCVPVAQWAIIEHEKITSIEILFDATEYSLMFPRVES